jgi:O-antigen/teichoic acid export membrane protein
MTFSANATLILSIIFLAGLRFISPALLPLRSSPMLISSFLLLSISTGLGQITGYVFLARRRFLFSLITISAQSILAIVILLLFPASSSSVIHAYSFSAFIGFLVSLGLFLFFVQPGFRFHLTTRSFKQTRLTGYLASSFVADQVQRNIGALISLLVLNNLGPAESAYFFFAWTIALGLLSFVGGVSSTLFAEGANNPAAIFVFTQKAIKLGITYSSLVVLVVSLFSPFILSLYGPTYRENGLVIFLFLLFSIIPGIFVAIFIAFLRVKANSWALVAYTGLDFLVCILFSFFFMLFAGLNGLGAGWLIARLLMLLITWTLWKREIRAYQSLSTPFQHQNPVRV